MEIVTWLMTQFRYIFTQILGVNTVISGVKLGDIIIGLLIFGVVLDLAINFFNSDNMPKTTKYYEDGELKYKETRHKGTVEKTRRKKV